MRIILITIRMKASGLHGDIDKVFLRGSLAVDDGKLIQEKLGKYIKRGLRQPLNN